MKKLLLLAERTLTFFNWIPLLVARISVGSVFAESGWGKLHSLDKVTAFFTELGIPFPHLQAPFVAGCEFVFGLALIFGFGTRIAAIFITAIMVVALKTAKSADIEGLTGLFGLSEFQFIVVCLILLFFGPGLASIDALFHKLGKSRPV